MVRTVGMLESMSLKTIFFDWGGVIANDPGDDFLSQLLRQLGASEQQVEEIFETYMWRFMCGEITEAEYWTQLRDHYGFAIDDSISDEFMKWQGLKANPDILALVAEAKAQGLRTAVFTNVIEPTYNVLERAGYYARFDAVVASCKLGVAKPDLTIYEKALDMLETTAEASLFIDDKPNNLAPARKLGFATVLAASPEQIVRDVRQLLPVRSDEALRRPVKRTE